jgi:hypothetical protein
MKVKAMVLYALIKSSKVVFSLPLINSFRDYIIESDRCLLLPALAQIPVTTKHEFHKDECVLAIFPQTTVFYPATVVAGPKKVFIFFDFPHHDLRRSPKAITFYSSLMMNQISAASPLHMLSRCR